MAVSKGSGSINYESGGQININLKQPENAEKLHLNFYLNQGRRSEYNAFFQRNLTTNGYHFTGTFEDSKGRIEVKMIPNN